MIYNFMGTGGPVLSVQFTPSFSSAPQHSEMLSVVWRALDTPLSFSTSVTGDATLVPEPSTWAMMLLGFAGLGYAGYRRTQKGQAVPA